MTTARVTHATPAATYAHVADRDWECGISESADNPNPRARDIAWQLVNTSPGNRTKVILGGGRAAFRPYDQGETQPPDDVRVRVPLHYTARLSSL